MHYRFRILCIQSLIPPDTRRKTPRHQFPLASPRGVPIVTYCFTKRHALWLTGSCIQRACWPAIVGLAVSSAVAYETRARFVQHLTTFGTSQARNVPVECRVDVQHELVADRTLATGTDRRRLRCRQWRPDNDVRVSRVRRTPSATRILCGENERDTTEIKHAVYRLSPAGNRQPIPTGIPCRQSAIHDSLQAPKLI